MKFYTSKDSLHFLGIWTPVIILFGIKILGWTLYYDLLDYFLLTVLLIKAFLTWFNTSYILTDNYLILKTSWGPIKISPESIQKIRSDTDLFGEMGSAVGLSTKGLRLYLDKPVRFGLLKRKNVKISPKQLDLFIQELLKKNEKIKNVCQQQINASRL